MFRKVFIPVCAVLLFSCSGKNKEQVLNMSDLTPHAKKEVRDSQMVKDTTNPSLFNLSLADSCGIRIQEFSELNDPMFPDRFMPKSKFKLNLHAKESSLVMGQWTYTDSVKTMNAFFNWLDCFGPECKAIKLGEEANMQKDGLLFFINDTSMTYLTSKLKLDLNNWQQYLEKYDGVDQWDLVVWQQPRKNALWMRYDVLPGKKKKQFLPLITKK